MTQAYYLETKMLEQILVFVSSLCVSGIAGYFLSKKSSVRIIFRDSFISSVIGGTLCTLILVQCNLTEFSRLAQNQFRPNLLAQVDQKLQSSLTNSLISMAMQEQRTRIERQLKQLLQGRIELADEGEVVRNWFNGFDRCASSVIAINYVSPVYWTGRNEFGVKQESVQGNALQRGVSIRRLFVLSMQEDEKETEALNTLINQQKSIGVELRFISLRDFTQSSAYRNYVASLNNPLDIVIFDLVTLLVTETDPTSRRIQNGFLTTERKMVDDGRNFFERVWEISSLEPPRS